MRIIRAGQLTTVQDLGRCGHRAEGVPQSGAADAFALRVANALVGNPESAAGLEFTFAGPEVEFSEPVVVALGGATCDGMEPWTLRAFAAGERLALGGCTRGCRGYLAIAGGVEVPLVLGSRSTYLRGSFGGHEGRALRDGDVLRIAVGAGDILKADAAALRTRWRIDPRILPTYTSEVTLRVIAGAQAEEFGLGWIESVFEVSTQSDRMGLRLKGASLTRASGEELLSSAVAPGTIQVPPDGNPVVLLADGQTIGGYPQIGHVITVDLPLVAQLRPGDTVRFSLVELDEAHRLLRAREHAIALLKQGLRGKLGALF
jgi:antagonist of KipI